MERAVLTDQQIANNLSWLLENGSPAVRYLTHAHLLDTHAEDLAGLWQEVEASTEAQAILAAQRADGSWFSANPWAGKPSYEPAPGYSPFTPKYVTAVWVLSVLGDTGFTVQDSRIHRAVEYILAYQWSSGLFSRANVRPASDDPRAERRADRRADNAPCELGVYLTALGKVGMGTDPRLTRSYDLLRRWQREDGGWISQWHKEQRNWWRSCPASSHGAVMALYHSGRPECWEALRRGLEFLVWHLSLKQEAEIRTFLYHGHNMVRELIVLSELGVGLAEPPVRALLDWLAGMYRPDEAHFSYQGRRPTSSSPGWQRYGTYHLVEDDWLTYYATRVAINLRLSRQMSRT
jgi:hypothetical protein